MSKININNLSTKAPKGTDRNKLDNQTEKSLKKIGKLQEPLMADKKKALLIIIQGIDASGKDGTVKNIFTGINPQGIDVTSFKAPSELERSHDFLWRIHQEVPVKGKIKIFNRSQYEDILVPTVHKLFTNDEIEERYELINDFERLLKKSGTTIVKLFLHISKDEQTKRFNERKSNPEKFWKFKQQDIEESKHWDKYMDTYNSILNRCKGWVIVPADDKWYRNHIVAKHVMEAMEKMKCEFPNQIEK